MYGNYKRDDFSRSEGFVGKKRISYQLLAKVLCIGLILASFFIFMGCKPQQTVVEREKLVYVTKDSIIHRDSMVYAPYEVVKDYSLDTLVMQTSLAISKSWLDTSTLYIVGELKNKKAFEVKYVEVEKWRTKDSLVYVEKPIPYEVVEYKVKRPWWAWICLTWAIITILSIAWNVYRKLKRIG